MTGDEFIAKLNEFQSEIEELWNKGHHMEVSIKKELAGIKYED